MEDRWYQMEDELARLTRTRGAVAGLPAPIMDATVEVVDALIAKGTTSRQAANDANETAAEDGTKMRSAVDTLNDYCTRIRSVGESQFRRKDPLIADRFEAVPVYASAPQDILARLGRLVAAWSHVPNPDTWEPIPDINRVALLALIAAAEPLVKTAAETESDAKMATAKMNEVAVATHDFNVAWYDTAINSYTRNSPEWRTVHAVLLHEHEAKGPTKIDPSH